MLTLLVLASCTPPPIVAPKPKPPATTLPVQPLPLPPGPPCTRGIAPGNIAAAVAAAAPGAVLCVTAGDLGARRVHLTRDGTSAQRIVLRAVGRVTTTGIDIDADWWTVEGFIVNVNRAAPAAPGISVMGMGIAVNANRVQGGTDYGISCDIDTPCNGARIARNVVTKSVGTGIWVYGNDIVAEGNDVSGSVQVGSSDADGFRFFGNRITLRGNYIHDIDAKASPGDPHTDCFQTFTESKQPITDVLVERNTCDRVTDQCLIAEGEATSSRRLRFVNNICRNSGSQALLLNNLHVHPAAADL